MAAREAAAPFDPDLEILSDSPPMLLDEASPIHRHLSSLVGQSAGASVSFATDAGWLQRLGLDCAIFGPGSIDQAHQPDEYITLEQFEAGAAFLRRLAATCANG